MVLNNVTRLMFKDKLITIKLGNYFNVMEYSHKIQNIQFEFEAMVKLCMNKTWWKVCSTPFLTILEGSYKHSMGTCNSQLLLKLEILIRFVQEEGCLAFQAKNMNNIHNVEAKLMFKM